MTSRNAITRPSTSNYLPMAKIWLKECVEKHEHCSKAELQEVLPTRLLCLSGDRVRLIHSVNLAGTRLPYATLSHCWGSIEFFKLCKENLQDLQECVPETELTNTFCDAIYITRSLGLDYLWIDSLCIIQDDEQDWQRESALMSRVYGGSTINIAAAGSFDGNGGCLYHDVAPRERDKAFRYCLKMPGLQEDRLWELAPMYSTCIRNALAGVISQVALGLCKRGSWHLEHCISVGQICSGSARKRNLVLSILRDYHEISVIIRVTGIGHRLLRTGPWL
jgi:hypothetical protein